jgi:DNA-binding protein YbaB
VAMLEDLLTAAVNAALSASREHMQKELAKVSGGLTLPGLT